FPSPPDTPAYTTSLIVSRSRGLAPDRRAHRRAMGVRNLVGEQFDDLVGFVGVGRQPHRLVGIALRRWIFLDPLHHAVVAPEYQTPLRHRLPEIVGAPRIGSADE